MGWSAFTRGSRDHLYQPLHIADELAETRDFGLLLKDHIDK